MINKFILDEEETIQLLTAFFQEALKFINVSEDNYPAIKKGPGFYNNGFEPIHIEFEKCEERLSPSFCSM